MFSKSNLPRYDQVGTFSFVHYPQSYAGLTCVDVQFGCAPRGLQYDLISKNLPTHFYRPPMKLREGNVFTPVFLSTGGMVSLPVWLPGPMFLGGGGSASGGLPSVMAFWCSPFPDTDI